MDIVSAYTGMQATATMAKIQIAVARKAMDVQRMQGGAALELLQAASSGAANAGDQLTAAAIGLGANIDVYG